MISSHTNIGKLIRVALRSKYNHAAISLDKDLTSLYSFARYNHNSPLAAGFVNERLSRYYHFGNPPIKIFKIKLNKKELKRVKRELKIFELNQNGYFYNLISAVLTPFRRRYPLKNSYTCIEFTVHMLGIIGKVKNETGHYNFKKLEEELESNFYYEGNLYDYTKKVDLDIGNYLEKKAKWDITKETSGAIKKVILAILS